MTTNTKTKNTFKIGQKFNKTYPVEAAIWCNENNAYIEDLNGVYTIMENAPVARPTTAEKVQALENETGLNRAVRELVLAENSGASEYVKAKANEIEELAKQLRVTEEASATVDNTQNDEYTSFGDTKQ